MHAEISDLRAAFDRLVADLPGELVAAVVPRFGAEPVVLGDDRAFHAWSTIKVPVLAGLLSVVHRDAFTPRHHELAELTITESDNPAILQLWEMLEELAGGAGGAAAVVEQLFRLSGDAGGTVALAPPPPGAVTPFGQTEWSAADSARFFSALAGGRLLNAHDTRYVLGLMKRIVLEQRWGLGSVDFGGPIAFKGGWGPEADGACMVRQSGVVLAGAPGSAGLTVSLVAVPPPGEDSFELGVQMVSQAAGWIADAVRPSADLPGRG